jgi:hypothetical protein
MRPVLLLIVLLLTVNLAAQDFYDIGTVNEIRLYFTQSNWDAILDQLVANGLEERLVGTAIINGVTYDSVGVRYKGNSSYSANRIKNPFNIKLDHIIDDQTVGPYGTLRLANGFMDPTLVREVLAYEIARKYFPACKANYANVYVNDVLIGIYTNDQDPDDYFGEVHYQAGDSCRIKGEISSMTPWQIWGYVNDDPASYTGHYELDSGASWAPFIHFLNVFNNNPAQMETVLNVDRHLWFLAFENCLVNLDSPINNGQNYYIFEDSNGRFNPTPWDLNECFGVFTNMQTIGNLNLTQMQNLSPLVNSTHPNYPIILKVLSNPLYKRMYIAHMRTLLEENITNNWYYNRALELQSICGPSVQADPNYFFTYSNFTSNLTSTISGTPQNPRTIYGITQLMNARANYLLNSTFFAGTVPTVSLPVYAPAVVMANSTVHITVQTTGATTAYLGWRQLHSGPYTRVLMFDDGQHNDGSASDGIFGADLDIFSGDVEYYIYAENANQGRFLPARAESEYLTIPVQSSPVQLKINEIMASNSSIPDPFGEADDWVEVYNPGSQPVDLAGCYLTDNHYGDGITPLWQIPYGYPGQTTIPAYGFKVLWFDEDLSQGPLHINTKLGASGDAVYLINPDSTTIVDAFSWSLTSGLNTPDVSIGRYPDGSDNWTLFGGANPHPVTPGTANYTTASEAEPLPAAMPSLSIYPNPAREAVRFELKNTTLPGTVKVYNLLGQLVREIRLDKDGKALWDRKGSFGKALGSGIYFCRVRSGKFEHTAKLVLIR